MVWLLGRQFMIFLWLCVSEAVNFKCCFPLEPKSFPVLTVRYSSTSKKGIHLTSQTHWHYKGQKKLLCNEHTILAIVLEKYKIFSYDIRSSGSKVNLYEWLRQVVFSPGSQHYSERIIAHLGTQRRTALMHIAHYYCPSSCSTNITVMFALQLPSLYLNFANG